MSDIVERLRTRPTGDPYLHMMVHEAADEIERLRAEVAGLRAELLKSLADNAALRERVKVLEDALRGLMVGCKYCNIQGQWHWHEKAIASNEALDAARAALAARKGEA